MGVRSSLKLQKKGDLAAFNRLVLQYQDMAYGVAYRITGNPHLADDATQEAFISAYRGLPKFRGGSFRAWLMRIVTNACYDELRRRKRHPQVPLDALYVEDPPSGAYSSSPLEGPEDHVQRQELGQLIQAGIDLLPDDQRLVLVLSDVQGFSYQEIAQAVGTPTGTVKSRLHRARAKLRDYLQDRQELLPTRYRLSSEPT